METLASDFQQPRDGDGQLHILTQYACVALCVPVHILQRQQQSTCAVFTANTRILYSLPPKLRSPHAREQTKNQAAPGTRNEPATGRRSFEAPAWVMPAPLLGSLLSNETTRSRGVEATTLGKPTPFCASPPVLPGRGAGPGVAERAPPPLSGVVDCLAARMAAMFAELVVHSGVGDRALPFRRWPRPSPFLPWPKASSQAWRSDRCMPPSSYRCISPAEAAGDGLLQARIASLLLARAES